MVWRTRDNKWVRDLVVIENSRAVLCGKWNYSGQKFAVGTGDHVLFLGYYEEDNSWWQSKRKIRKLNVQNIEERDKQKFYLFFYSSYKF